MSTLPENELPEGYEQLTPEFLREHGAQEGMKSFHPKFPEQSWLDSVYPVGAPIQAHDFDAGLLWCAPLGTMAMVSTPLPEVVCDCSMHPPFFVHSEHCSAHPRNARVKVLPGWLSELKNRPDNLECCYGKHKGQVSEWGACGGEEWPFSEVSFDLGEPADFAYSVPQYIYDAIESKKRPGRITITLVKTAKDKSRDSKLAFPGKDEPAREAESISHLLNSAAIDFRKLANHYGGHSAEKWQGYNDLQTAMERVLSLERELIAKRAHIQSEWNKWYSNVPGTEGHELRTLRHELTAARENTPDYTQPCGYCHKHPCECPQTTADSTSLIATPRTDEACNLLADQAPPIGDPAWQQYLTRILRVLTGLSATLERDLTAANATIAQLSAQVKRQYQRWKADLALKQQTIDALRAELSRVRTVADELAERLEATTHMLGNLIPDMRRHLFHETAISNVQAVAVRNSAVLNSAALPPEPTQPTP